MEKIIITCSAEYLTYEFPGRKWYQWNRCNRIALMRLPSVEEELPDADILLEVHENFETDFKDEGYYLQDKSRNENQEMICRIHPLYRREIYRAMLYEYSPAYQNMEHVIVLDAGDENFPDILPEMIHNCNYLTILTVQPGGYEHVLKQIEMDFGLIAMMFSQPKEFIRYIKQMKLQEAVVIAGSYEAGINDARSDEQAADDVTVTDRYDKKTVWTEKNNTSLLYCLPKSCFFVDFCTNDIFYDLILKKRMRFTYAGIPIFLDNTVKNRYNAVVNEGITFQVINKKTIWRRKGNKDGRKEEYSDL